MSLCRRDAGTLQAAPVRLCAGGSARASPGEGTTQGCLLTYVSGDFLLYH